MISKRCKELNLLNHIRQTNKADSLDISYIYQKNNINQEWKCVLKLKKNNKNYEFTENANKKKIVFLIF